MNLSLYSKLSTRSSLPSRRILAHLFHSSIARYPLYKRISPLGDPKISVVPILDQWVKEGKTVIKTQLQLMIKELTKYKRFKHALEISQWMSDRMFIPLSPVDVSARLNLILKVHGLEQVENYFSNIPKQLKGFQVYIALLNCYAHEKSVQNAEELMLKMKDMRLVRTPLCYNILMNLYYRMDDHQKLDALMLEMEQNGIHYDQFTLSIRLCAYAAASHVEGIDKIIERMESDPQVAMDWNAYAIAAHGYLKFGLSDKAIVMLKKLEGMINAKSKNYAFDLLLKLVADTGDKDELYRIWNLYKAKRRIYNKGYISMTSSLLKVDDIEGAEKIFKEWESQKLSYDFRVPNLLINAYCKKGLVEKAESLMHHAVVKGGEPSVDAYYCLASMYLEDNQIPKATGVIEKLICVCPPGWKPSKEILATCLEYLEGKGDMEGIDEFIKSLRNEDVFSAAVQDRLINHIKGGKSQSDALL